ncbi:MAG: hypothetical protein FWE38_04505 [Firmicutes bacterium]|nr:hypothetical protein [Bacillota bacterium]
MKKLVMVIIILILLVGSGVSIPFLAGNNPPPPENENGGYENGGNGGYENGPDPTPEPPPDPEPEPDPEPDPDPIVHNVVGLWRISRVEVGTRTWQPTHTTTFALGSITFADGGSMLVDKSNDSLVMVPLYAFFNPGMNINSLGDIVNLNPQSFENSSWIRNGDTMTVGDVLVYNIVFDGDNRLRLYNNESRIDLVRG